VASGEWRVSECHGSLFIGFHMQFVCSDFLGESKGWWWPYDASLFPELMLMLVTVIEEGGKNDDLANVILRVHGFF